MHASWRSSTSAVVILFSIILTMLIARSSAMATPTPTATPTFTIVILPPTPTATPTLTATATAVPKLTPAPAGLSVEPAPRLLNVGQVGIGESETRNLILHNRTTSAVSGLASMSNPSVWSISPNTVNIAARSTQTFMVTFSPTALGEQQASADFVLSAGMEASLMVPTEGDSVPGHLAIQHRVINFGRKPSDLTRTDVLGNNGKGMLTINIGALTSPFSNSPQGSATIAPRAAVTVTISYSGGQAKQTLTVTTNNPKQQSEGITVEGDVIFTSPTPTATMTSVIPPTATATSTVMPSPTATSTGGLPISLFATHNLAATMMGPPVTPHSQSLAANAETYNPETDSFRSVGRMNSPRVGASSTTLQNGMTLIAGGAICIEATGGARSCTPTNTAQLFNPSTHKFSTAGTGSNGHMNSARMGHSATLISGCNCALDGDVLLAGGNRGVESVGPDNAVSDTSPLQSAELYDPRDDSFIALPNPMVSPREEAIAAALPNNAGKILLAGGDSIGIFQNSIAGAEIFDPVTQTFTATAPMSLSRELADAIALAPSSVNGPLAGDILVTGGMSTVGNLAGASLNSAELYDPMTGKWTAVATPMDSPRALHSMTLITNGPAGGQVLILGGVVLQGPGGWKNLIRNSVASAELFNPSDGTFSKTTSMTAPRSAHSAILLDKGPNAGDVLIAGGQKCDGPACEPAATAAELFDPASGTWNPSKATTSPSLGAVLGDVVPVP